jgi:hypothetical protein
VKLYRDLTPGETLQAGDERLYIAPISVDAYCRNRSRMAGD